MAEFKHKHIIALRDLSKEDIELLISTAESMREINSSISSFDRSRRAIMCLCLNSAISFHPPLFFEYHFNRLV